MKLVEAMSGEDHSGMSASITNEIFYDLNNAYAGEGRWKENRHESLARLLGQPRRTKDTGGYGYAR